jgi:hypothetical protein
LGKVAKLPKLNAHILSEKMHVVRKLFYTKYVLQIYEISCHQNKNTPLSIIISLSTVSSVNNSHSNFDKNSKIVDWLSTSLTPPFTPSLL